MADFRHFLIQEYINFGPVYIIIYVGVGGKGEMGGGNC